MKSKILALIMAVVMAVGLVGCGNTTNPSSETPNGASVADSTSNTDTADNSSNTVSGEKNEDSDYYPVTVEVYNASKELVPYTFEKCPEKTLVYGKNNVEIMLALGLGDKIMMTADCSSVLPEYQEEFEKIPRVKDYQDVGYFVKEYALSLEPDMVIGWRSLFEMEDRMGDVGFWHERNIGTYTSINSVLKDNQSLENEYADIRNIARIYNKVDEAEAIISAIQADVEKGQNASAGKDPQRIFIAEKYEGEYDVYHAKTAAGDIATQLGAEVLGEKGWTDEQIVDANPEVIFAVHVSKVSDEEAVALYIDNPALASVDAVKNGRVYPVVYGLAYTPGVRTGQTVKLFLQALYGIE